MKSYSFHPLSFINALRLWQKIIRPLSFTLFCVALFGFAGTLAAETQKIKISIGDFPPFVFKNELKGFCIDMARIICKKNNLTPEFVRYYTVPELLASVESGQCDMCFAGLTITAEREKRVDFSQPFFDSGLIIAVKIEATSRSAYITNVVLKAVGFSLLLLFLGLTIVSHLVWFVEKDNTDKRSFSISYRKGIIEAYWWAVVTMTTVGYGDKYPKKTIGRLVASVWMIIGIIWFAGFTATLSSALTIDRIRHQEIEGPTDLKDKKVAVVQGTTSHDFMRFYNVNSQLVDSLDQLITNLKSGEADAAVYDAPTLMYTAKNDPSIKVVGDMFAEQEYGVAFPEKGQDHLKELFNIAIIDMKESGAYRKIYDKWF